MAYHGDWAAVRGADGDLIAMGLTQTPILRLPLTIFTECVLWV